VASVRDSVRDSVWDSVRDSVYGQHDAPWLSHFRFFRDAVGLRSETQRLDGLWELAQSAGWAIPCRDICFIAERHTALSRDERGRLHSEIGAAVEFPDGWRIHAIHGVRIPAWIIDEPAKLTLGAIEAERNTEIQRVMIERFGWDRYASECGAKVIDHDDRWGTLLRKQNQAGQPILFLRVVNRSPEPDGSFRRYVLPVHPECRPLPDPDERDADFGKAQTLTALNAVASTFGMTGAVYKRILGAES
jgi:hypothetical protein